MTVFAHAPYVGTSGYNSHCQNFFRKLSEYQKLKIRNFTVGKNWQASNFSSQEPHGKDIDNLDKSLIGLQTLWNPKGDLEDFEIHGFKKSDFNYDVNIILSEVNHYYFYQDYKGPKIAYTVWENTLYPEQFFNKLREYDQVWVPSKWQANITINQGIPADKVKIVPEGVDVDLFKPKNLAIEGDVFRFVLFGRWDARKSTREIIQSFKNVFGNNKKVELWISVDNPYPVDGLNSTEERLKKHNLECDNIKILHFPNRQQYIDILNSSHVFISCSRSEGWNLPLIEAMACGIPSIYSDCSGQLEFAEGKGIPVKISKEISPKEIKNSYCEMVDVAAGNWYEPDFKDLEDKLLYCYNNYEVLKQKALRDSDEIRKEFTWDNAAKKASAILEEFIKNYYKQEYTVEFHGTSEDKKGIYYKSSIKKPQRVLAQIIDDFSGFIFYEEELEIHNKCFFFTKHAYVLPNQVFKIYDYYTKELKLEHKLNQDLSFDLKTLKPENRNLISLVPENIRNSSYLGFSFLEIFHRKTYDFKSCKINRGDIVFDLGSCFGLFSRYAFSQQAFEVHAFEPNKELVDSNLALNKGYNFHFNNKAVHSKNVKFVKKYDYIGSSTEETEEVSDLNININQYIKEKNIKKIDYLKIDIEGAEYDFFENIDKDFLANNISKIALEYHFNQNNKINNILALLRNSGFICEFEYPEAQDKELGMLYAWKNQGFNFDNFFEKYRQSIEKSGVSRLKFYEYIIPKLVAKNKPLYILETGTMWAPLKDNMGAFTLIMGDLIKNYTGGKLYTVDISKKNLGHCKIYTNNFSSHIEYVESDSVSYIKNLSDEFIASLDLVYLDSWDFNFPQPHDSANHHLKEMMALYDRINPECPIAIDDNFLPNTYIMWNYFDSDGNITRTERFETYDKIMGKGMYCHDFLIKNNWKRFESFDVVGANNIFYYERSKLTIDEVKCILDNFYSKNKTDLPNSKTFTDIKNISNEPNGLGDALILTNLVPEKNIYSDFKDFFSLLEYTNYEFKKQDSYFDIYNSDLHKYNWGGGHCIQRLQKAFLGKCDLLPKPKLNKKYSPIKNKIAIHFESHKRKETALPQDIRDSIKGFLKQESYEIYDCSLAQNVKELIDEMSTCEYFIGIDSGPMHVAAAFEIKSVIILNHASTKDIYLPKIAESNIPNSEWLYPQNIHLAVNEGNELIAKFSISNLKNALGGYLYPYFSKDYLSLFKHETETVSIINESGSLGDFLAWTPMVSRYAKINKVKVNYYTPHKHLLEEAYPEINFYNYQHKNNINTPKTIKLGLFDGYIYQDKGLQQIACDLLGIPFEEEVCKLPQKFKNKDRFTKKYVCIAIQSTCQCKYWNNKTGWQQVVDYLKELGYEVICIDRYSNFGIQSHMNLMPQNCIDKTGDLPLEDRINDLFHCEFFIGLSSGLAWLAWACGKPVVMVSGFTDAFNEFINPYRVINKNVCNSCWNDVNLKFDAKNWLWCPRNKDFECSKEISFEMVKDKIDLIIKG